MYQDKSSIPQIDISTLLKKFDGKTERNLDNGKILRYSITKLPKYLILNIKRFHQNGLILEKNPTIVCFPVKRLDFKQCIYLKKFNRHVPLFILFNRHSPRSHCRESEYEVRLGRQHKARG